VNGDQFEQAEQRRVFGGSLARSWNGTLAGRDTMTTVGAQVRHDRLDPVGLYATVARMRTATTQEARVRETSLGLWVENATQWTPWLRSLAGLRADGYDFDVSSSIEANSGRRRAGIASPKLSLVFGPWSRTEYFVNAGYGFHSNDARGVTAAVDPADPLVRSKGAEVGVRTGIVPGLQSSLALWQLRLGSELVFAGDAGTTEASRASKRTGVEWNNHWVVNPHVLLDLDLAWSRARFTGTDPNVPPLGDYIPGSIEKVASFGVTLQDWGPWFGEFQLRYFGPRPLIEDDSQRSQSTTLAALRAGYRLGRDMTLTLDVFNLFDRKASDIDYYYTSRLKGEAQGVDDIHFHPVEPRSVRLTMTARF
jgi:outer membrane receptor protein involved in Fe transport